MTAQRPAPRASQPGSRPSYPLYPAPVGSCHVSTWLWETVFGPRPPFWWLHALLVWSLFGNREDGPYGIYAPKLAPPDRWNGWYAAWRWWSRNPMHNLWFHTLAVPLWWSVCLIGRPNESNYWPARVAGPDGVEVDGTGLIIALNPLPYLSFRSARWEGYFGYRPQRQLTPDGVPGMGPFRAIGAFGMALRKRH